MVEAGLTGWAAGPQKWLALDGWPWKLDVEWSALRIPLQGHHWAGAKPARPGSDCWRLCQGNGREPGRRPASWPGRAPWGVHLPRCPPPSWVGFPILTQPLCCYSLLLLLLKVWTLLSFDAWPVELGIHGHTSPKTHTRPAGLAPAARPVAPGDTPPPIRTFWRCFHQGK